MLSSQTVPRATRPIVRVCTSYNDFVFFIVSRTSKNSTVDGTAHMRQIKLLMIIYL
jgi:hypothetical protein